MEQKTHKHRHLIVLPFMALVLSLTFITEAPRVPVQAGMTLEPQEGVEMEAFSLPSGVQGVVFAGGQFSAEESDLDLLRGAALVTGQRLFRLQVADLELAGFDGAFHVIRSDHSISVSALTTPVSIQQGEQRMVVPVGQQWSVPLTGKLASLDEGFEEWSGDRALHLLPSHFVNRLLGILRTLDDPEDVLPVVHSSLPIHTSFSFDVLLLPTSRKQFAKQESEEVLGVLRQRVESGDLDGVTALLSNDTYTDVISSDRGVEVVSILLSKLGTEDSALQMQLLPVLLQHIDAWLIASVHPRFHAAAWSLDVPEVSVESQMVRLFVFPYADVSRKALSVFSWARYEDDIHRIAGEIQDPLPVFEHLFAVHIPLVARAEKRGYPERAEHLTEALLSYFDGIDDVPSRITALLKELQNRTRVAIEPIFLFGEDSYGSSTMKLKENYASETVKIEEPSSGLTPQEVEGRAYATLRDTGALFTVETGIAAVSSTDVRISDVLFSSSSGDRGVSFTLNVVSGMVSDIDLEGRSFPFDSQFDGFVSWVRK